MTIKSVEGENSGKMDWCQNSGCDRYKNRCLLQQSIVQRYRGIDKGMTNARAEYARLRRLVLTDDGRQQVKKECEATLFKLY